MTTIAAWADHSGAVLACASAADGPDDTAWEPTLVAVDGWQPALVATCGEPAAHPLAVTTLRCMLARKRDRLERDCLGGSARITGDDVDEWALSQADAAREHELDDASHVLAVAGGVWRTHGPSAYRGARDPSSPARWTTHGSGGHEASGALLAMFLSAGDQVRTPAEARYSLAAALEIARDLDRGTRGGVITVLGTDASRLTIP